MKSEDGRTMSSPAEWPYYVLGCKQNATIFSQIFLQRNNTFFSEFHQLTLMFPLVPLPLLIPGSVKWFNTLIHLLLNKMDAILADDVFRCIFFNEHDRSPIQISLKFVPRSPIDNKPALVQVMVWHRIGDNSLPEPMVAQFTDVYMRYLGEMS